MGPCNGIYFLKGFPNIIMNPSLSQFIALPEPFFADPIWPLYPDHYPSFGFDPKTNDYKVVLLTGVKVDFEAMKKWTVELYSLNSNSWKILEDNPIPFPFDPDTSRVFIYVNDCCHWWGCAYESHKEESDDVENVVLSFDMISEMFRKIKVPKLTDYFSSRNLVPFSESATIGVLEYYYQDQGTKTCFCFDVWVMKDYRDEESWIKRYSVNHTMVIYKQLYEYYERNQSLWKTRERLVLYGLDSEEHTRNLLDCVNYEDIGVVRYMESLVSLLPSPNVLHGLNI